MSNDEKQLYLGALCGVLFVALVLQNPFCQSLLFPLGLLKFPSLKVIGCGLLFALVNIVGKEWICVQLQKHGLENIARPSSTIWRTITSTTIPPITEEIICRGILQPKIGLLGAALVFAYMHISVVSVWNVFTGKLFAGLCMGVALLCTGNIWAPIIAHSVSNLWFSSYGILRQAYIGKAIRLLNSKDFSLMLATLTSAPDSHRNAMSYRLESVALRHLDRAEEAITAATKAIEMFDWFAYTCRGEAYMKIDELEKARHDLEIACKKFPKIARPHQLAAELANKENRFEEAARQYEKAFALDKRPVNLALAGMAYYHNSQLQQAKDCCQRALARDPKLDLAQKLSKLIDMVTGNENAA